jgi:hypothetical protein
VDRWSKWSISQSSNVVLRGKPLVPPQPKELVQERTKSSVKLCWAGSRSQTSSQSPTNFDLWGNDGVGTSTARDFKLIAKGEMHR